MSRDNVTSFNCSCFKGKDDFKITLNIEFQGQHNKLIREWGLIMFFLAWPRNFLKMSLRSRKPLFN